MYRGNIATAREYDKILTESKSYSKPSLHACAGWAFRIREHMGNTPDNGTQKRRCLGNRTKICRKKLDKMSIEIVTKWNIIETT